MPWREQTNNPDVKVIVNGESVRDPGRPDFLRTDFEIIDKTAPGGPEKTHLSIDLDGNPTIHHGNQSILGD